MRERVHIIPLTKLAEHLQAFPWLDTIQAQLSERPVAWETPVHHESTEYHVIVQRDCLIIIEPALPGPPEFYNLRALQQRMQLEMRNHLDGLAHNLRGPISNIRSRSELMLQFMEMDPSFTSSSLGGKAKAAFSRFLEASDEINNQLQEMERCLRWLDPRTSPEPIRIREAFQTLHNCLMTDLSYKRNIQCRFLTSENVPLWTGHPHLLLEPLLYLMRHITHVLLETGKGIIQMTAEVSAGNLVLTVSGHGADDREPPTDTVDWVPLTGQQAEAAGTLLHLASWVLAAADARLEQHADANGLGFCIRYPVNHD